MAKNKNRAIKYIKASGSQEPGIDLAEIIGAARDITERRQAEEALRDSESKYRTLFESSTDAIMTLDENGFIDCNTATLKMFGCNQKSEFTTLHPADISPPNQPDGTDSRAAADLRIAEAFKKGSSQFEWIHRTRNGEDFPAEVLLSAFKLGEKQVLQATVRDITERRQGEETLKESEQRFKAIFDNAVDGMVLADLESKKFYTCNKMFSQMSGYSLEEIKNLGIVDIHPEKDLPYVTQQFEKQVAGEITLAEDIPVKRKDGSIFYADVNSSLITVSSKSYMMGIFRDTTERKKAREELRRSEEYFRALMENSLDAVTIMNEDGTIRYESPSYERLLGFKPDERVGSNLFERIHPDDITGVAELFAEFLPNRGGTIHAEVRAQHKDGSWRHIEAIGQNLLDNPIVKGIVINLRDITERKRAEEALRESEAKLKLYLGNSPDGIYISDVGGDFLYGNREAERVTGYPRGELLGKSFLKLSLLPPEHLQKAAQLLELNMAGRPTGPDEFELVRKDGSRVSVEISTYPIGEGAKLEVIGIARDITERKRMEEKLLHLSDAVKMSKDSIVISDLEGRIVEANEATLRMHGMENKTDFVGKTALEIIAPEDREIMAEKVVKALAEGELKYVEYHALKNDGSKFLVEASISVMKDGKGEPTGYMAVTRDITERKRMEEELRLLSDAVKMTSESIAIADLKGKILDINEAGLRMYGLNDRADLVGKDPFEIIVPEDQQKALESMAKILVEGSLKTVEYRILKKDGSKALIETSVSLIRGEKGEPKSIVAVARDITEHRRMEEALHESEARYRLLAENVKDVIWTADLNLRLTYISPSHTQLTGYSVEEALAQTLDKLMTPASGEVVAKGFAEELALEESGPGDLFRSRIFEVEANCKDGSTIPVEMKAAFLRGLVGQPIGILGITRDIRERKKAEEALRHSERRFRDIADNAFEWIWEVDPNGKYTYSNPTVEKILGYTPVEVLEKHFYDLLHPDDKERVKNEAFEVFARKEPFRESVNKNLSKDGRTVWLSTSGVPLLDEKGNLVGYRGADTDITERKKAEEAIRELDRLKAEFISNISHELRTPLHSIKGFGKLILDGKVPDPNVQREFLTIIESQSNRLDKLVSNLLDVSRLEAGRFSIQKQRISIGSTVHEAVETLRGVANGRGITIKEDIPATLPEIDVDKERLEQVMFNLLGNAVKFSNDGSEVTVRAEVKEHDLLVQVTDQGIGIPRDAMPRLFQRFYRVEASSSIGGSGLGLYISRQIIEAHGGRIWVESEPAVGSTFSFTLPLGAMSQDGGASHE
jgi:PAS domain S-box-containing protein